MENKNIFTKIKAFVQAHKVWSVIILLTVVYGGWRMYSSATSTDGELRYVTAVATKGTIISAVSASGQIESTNQVDLKARASGEVNYIAVKPGDRVRKGKTLFGINSKNAQKTVRNAETSLESAKLELEKFQKAPDTVEVLEIKKAIADAELSKADAQKSIDKAYRDLLNSSITAVSNITGNTQTPPTITGTYTKDQEAVINVTVYQAGTGGYFNAVSIPSGIVNASGNIDTIIPQALGDTGLYIKFATSGAQPNWTITLPNKSVNAYDANYKAWQDAIANKKKVEDTSELTIAQNNKKLADLYQPDSLELRSKQLAIKQAEDNLLDAKADLSDYYVFAPFDGVMATVDAKIGETASASLGSIVTNQQIAKLSLNEVDVAKVKLGQKATLTFDAIEDLSITGTVVEIDTLGAVAQGVVSYSVKVALDTSNATIKPGMSVAASIITDSKTDVLTVLSAAVKSRNGENYVEMFNPPLAEPMAGEQGTVSLVLPTQMPVEIGITDDTSTEIISGLLEGDQVVSRTITSSTKAAATSAPSLFGGGSGGSTRALSR